MKRILMLLLTLAMQPALAKISAQDEARYFDTNYRTKKLYSNKVDFAKLEFTRPLTKEFLKKISVDDIVAMDQEMADQLYARLTAGPIPEGVYDGKARVMDDSAIKLALRVFSDQQKLKAIAGPIANPDTAGAVLETMANTMWNGKEFFKKDGLLRNIIPENPAVGAQLNLLVADFDYKRLKAEPVFIRGRTVSAWKLFPAKLYCGQSLLDSRRESVIIDYAYGDRLPGYDESIDSLATRHGVYVRDEIRMVRPGLYLGKAYMGRTFFLSFVLSNDKVMAENASADWSSVQECWTGTQKITYL